MGRDQPRGVGCHCIRVYSLVMFCRGWHSTPGPSTSTYLGSSPPHCHPHAGTAGCRQEERRPRRASGSEAGLQAPGEGGGTQPAFPCDSRSQQPRGNGQLPGFGVFFNIQDGNGGSPELMGGQKVRGSSRVRGVGGVLSQGQQQPSRASKCPSQQLDLDLGPYLAWRARGHIRMSPLAKGPPALPLPGKRVLPDGSLGPPHQPPRANPPSLSPPHTPLLSSR